ncbi:MAG TPA: hypothetical protein VKA15_26955 [Isosphaeraceae bacterium]|nr:hypothetical protein [Isosphaeraceae bacterium]
MKSSRPAVIAMFIAVVLSIAVPAAFAAYRSGVRQYYDSTWTYSPSYGYYYVHYYYRPVVTYTTYEYHYCIYYPTQPSYIYYYNPTAQVYWGRYELGSKGDKRYSLLAEKDRKKELKEIPDQAFPKPAKMPVIPGAKDDVAIEPPPENVPKDKPAK